MENLRPQVTTPPCLQSFTHIRPSRYLTNLMMKQFIFHQHIILQGSSHTSLPPPTSLSSSLLAPGDLRQSLGRNSAVTAISEEGEGECGLSTQFIDWSARYEILS